MEDSFLLPFAEDCISSILQRGTNQSVNQLINLKLFIVKWVFLGCAIEFASPEKPDNQKLQRGMDHIGQENTVLPSAYPGFGPVIVLASAPWGCENE